jgi:DNA primase
LLEGATSTASVTSRPALARCPYYEEGLPNWPKLYGGKGIHLMVPFDRGMNWDKAHAYARRIAQRMASTAPKLYTTSATAQREGRLFIDWQWPRRHCGWGPFAARPAGLSCRGACDVAGHRERHAAGCLHDQAAASRMNRSDLFAHY